MKLSSGLGWQCGTVDVQLATVQCNRTLYGCLADVWGSNRIWTFLGNCAGSLLWAHFKQSVAIGLDGIFVSLKRFICALNLDHH